MIDSEYDSIDHSLANDGFMSDKEKDNQHNDQNPESSSTKSTDKEQEHRLQEIEKELAELRPQPPSPETKRRIEEEEKKKDRQAEEKKQHGKQSPATSATSKHNNEHPSNELTPGQPDPTVSDNVNIPVLNDHGDIELKAQQGSALHNHQPITEEKF